MKFKRGSSVLRTNLHYGTPLPKVELIRENRRQKTKASALLIDICVKVALEAGEGTRAKPVKCKRSFSDSQNKLRELKQLKKECW